MISCGVLVARIVCNALRSGRILQYPGQLIGNFKIGVRIQMTIGSQGRLYFFVSQALFDQMQKRMVGNGSREKLFWRILLIANMRKSPDGFSVAMPLFMVRFPISSGHW